MPNLNKRQKEFRKQMQELQSVKTYKEIMNDHDSFYHNTALENEIKYKAALKEKRKNYIIGLIILFFIISAAYYNFDSIKEFYKSKLKSTNFTDITKQVIYKVSSEEIQQNKVGEYHKKYTKKIENLNIVMNEIIDANNFQNSDILKIQEQETLIDELIIEFENYIPEDINKNLHNLNIKQLYNYKELYPSAELLTAGFYENDLINNYNNAVVNILNTSEEFRKEIINIFKNINIKYTFLENGTINFTYPDI